MLVDCIGGVFSIKIKIKGYLENTTENEKIEIENKRTIEERDKKIDIYINEKNKLEKQIKEMEIIIKEENINIRVHLSQIILILKLSL